MDELCVTYVDDEHVGNHDYDDNTDDDHDSNNMVIYRWSIDDISMIYRWSIDKSYNKIRRKATTGHQIGRMMMISIPDKTTSKNILFATLKKWL